MILIITKIMRIKDIVISSNLSYLLTTKVSHVILTSTLSQDLFPFVQYSLFERLKNVAAYILYLLTTFLYITYAGRVTARKIKEPVCYQLLSCTTRSAR